MVRIAAWRAFSAGDDSGTICWYSFANGSPRAMARSISFFDSAALLDRINRAIQYDALEISPCVRAIPVKLAMTERRDDDGATDGDDKGDDGADLSSLFFPSVLVLLSSSCSS